MFSLQPFSGPVAKQARDSAQQAETVDLLAPVLVTLADPVRKQAERTIARVVQRVKEYDALAAEHTAKQRTYDVNERILRQLKGGPNAPSLEATEMRQRQAALDDELQGIEARLAGLTKVLGWPA